MAATVYHCKIARKVWIERQFYFTSKVILAVLRIDVIMIIVIIPYLDPVRFH